MEQENNNNTAKKLRTIKVKPETFTTLKEIQQKHYSDSNFTDKITLDYIISKLLKQ